MDEKPLNGKVALVTGAYRNLGAVTAETLAEYGATLVINDLENAIPYRDNVLKMIQQHGGEANAIEADLSKGNQVRFLADKALASFGHVDILVNNAGPFNMDPYIQLEEESWDRVMNVNLKAIYLLVKYLAPEMKTNGWGRIVSMCAGSAYVRNHNVYTLAKKGVEVITESLALELGPEIMVNAIAPGQILESLPDIAEFDPTFGDRYTARAPAKRLVTRKEIATIITLLCTPAFSGMTGMTLRVDGGAELPRF
jgi:3-oxoacyl-[acyl-carrier protein] reductase